LWAGVGVGEAVVTLEVAVAAVVVGERVR